MDRVQISFILQCCGYVDCLVTSALLQYIYFILGLGTTAT